MLGTFFGRLRLGAGAIAFSVGLAILSLGSGSTALAQGAAPGLDRAHAAKAAHAAGILAIDGVVGLGVGRGASGDAAIVITTARRGIAGIPRSLDGVAVRVMVTGPFHANPKPNCDVDPSHPSCADDGGTTAFAPTDTWPRPVPIGVSTGNIASCSSGTIGARVVGGGTFALSNNHVFALENAGNIGDDILQPGRFDTNCVADADASIGTLADFVPLFFDGTPNYVDAAIATTTNGNLANATPPDGYGTPSSVPFAGDALDLKVQKYGRSTGPTRGTVVIVGWTGNIGYVSGTARFDDQIVIYSQKGPFLKSGDSGSLVVTDDNFAQPVALIFAGNSSGKYGIANPIDAVLDALNVTIDGN
jgi:hypothetical protein